MSRCTSCLIGGRRIVFVFFCFIGRKRAPHHHEGTSQDHFHQSYTVQSYGLCRIEQIANNRIPLPSPCPSKGVGDPTWWRRGITPSVDMRVSFYQWIPLNSNSKSPHCPVQRHAVCCTSDSVCSCLCSSDKSKRRTKTVKKSAEPKWNQTFLYSHVHRRDFRERMLEITVWDQPRVQEEESEFLGEVGDTGCPYTILILCVSA